MKRVEKGIDQNKDIRIIAYSVNPGIEHKVKAVLSYVLKKHGCDILLSPIYTCVKELLINAIKANYKNIYFENYALKNKSEHVINYETAMKLFKLEIRKEEARYLSRMARKKGLKAEILLQQVRDNLRIAIFNPVIMTSTEMQTVIKKLKDAEKCSDITEYLLNNEDDPNVEGAGLGLILISMILKSLGIGQTSLSVRSVRNQTVASLSIPLTRRTLQHYERNTEAKMI